VAGTVTRLGALGPHWDLRTDRLAVLDERVLLLQLNGPRALGLRVGATVEVKGRQFAGMDPGGEGLLPVAVDWRCAGQAVTVTAMGDVPDPPKRARRQCALFPEESLDAELAGLQPREALLKLHVLREVLDSLEAVGVRAVLQRGSPGGRTEASLLSQVFALVCPPLQSSGSVEGRRDSSESTPPFSPLDAVPRMRHLFEVFRDLEGCWKRELEYHLRPDKAATNGVRSGEALIFHGSKKSGGEWMLGDVEVRGSAGCAPTVSFIQGGHSVPLVLATEDERRSSGGQTCGTAEKPRQHRSRVFLKAFRAVLSGTAQGRRKAFTLFASPEDVSFLSGDANARGLFQPWALGQGSLHGLSVVLQVRPMEAKMASKGRGRAVSFSGCVLHMFNGAGKVRLIISGCPGDALSARSDAKASISPMKSWLDRIEVYVSTDHVSLSGVVPGAICVLKCFKRHVSRGGEVYCASTSASKLLVADIRHVADPTWPHGDLLSAYSAALKGGKRRPRPFCIQHIQEQGEAGAIDKRAHVVSGQLSDILSVELVKCCVACLVPTDQGCSCLAQSTLTLAVKLRFDDTTGKIVIKADGRAAWDLLGIYPSQENPDFRFLLKLASKYSRLRAQRSDGSMAEGPQIVISATEGVVPMEYSKRLGLLLMGKSIFGAPQVLLLGQKVAIPPSGFRPGTVDLKVLEVQPVSHQLQLSALSDLLPCLARTSELPGEGKAPPPATSP
jgi:hypothetical protein